jgi:hypothetical protein
MRRKGQKKPDGTTATPTPTCPKCEARKGESIDLIRTYSRGVNAHGRRTFIPDGWRCPDKSCDFIMKDFVEIEDDLTEMIQ